MERIAFYSKWTLRISIIAAAIYDLFILRWVGIGGGTAIFLVTYLLDYINKDKRRISDKLIALFCIFCIFSLVIGVMLNFYDKISWWDLLMHFVSGILLGIVGNAMLNKIQNGKKIEALTRFLFVVGIACIGGILWEMYEFAADFVLGIDTQKVILTGVSDTMGDLITNLLGAIIAGAYFSKFDGNVR